MGGSSRSRPLCLNVCGNCCLNKANIKLASYYSGQRKRFLNNCAGQWNDERFEQLRGTMVYYIHRIEKGLSHKHFRSGFGRSAFIELKAMMERWRELGYPVDDHDLPCGTECGSGVCA